jgi:hypothetical protein
MVLDELLEEVLDELVCEEDERTFMFVFLSFSLCCNSGGNPDGYSPVESSWGCAWARASVAKATERTSRI